MSKLVPLLQSLITALEGRLGAQDAGTAEGAKKAWATRGGSSSGSSAVQRDFERISKTVKDPKKAMSIARENARISQRLNKPTASQTANSNKLIARNNANVKTGTAAQASGILRGFTKPVAKSTAITKSNPVQNQLAPIPERKRQMSEAFKGRSTARQDPPIPLRKRPLP